MRFGERVKSVTHRLSAILPKCARFNRGTQSDLLFIVQSQGFQMGGLGYSCLQLGSNHVRRNAVCVSSAIVIGRIPDVPQRPGPCEA